MSKSDPAKAGGRALPIRVTLKVVSCKLFCGPFLGLRPYCFAISPCLIWQRGSHLDHWPRPRNPIPVKLISYELVLWYLAIRSIYHLCRCLCFNEFASKSQLFTGDQLVLRQHYNIYFVKINVFFEHFLFLNVL